MTRQPAAEKRFTVAWPMPRLAPVSSSVRRGWLDAGRMRSCRTCDGDLSDCATRSSRIEPRLAPRRADARRGGTRCGRAGGTAGPARTRSPAARRDSRTSTAAAARCRCAIFGGVERDRLLEGEAAFERRRLLARPGADLRQPRRGWRNRRRPPRRSPARPGRARAPGACSDFQWNTSAALGLAASSRPFWLSRLV